MTYSVIVPAMRAVLVSLAMCASATAATLSPPTAITYDGLDYKLSYQQVQPEGEAGIYEYTTGGETVDNWTRMITVVYRRGIIVTPKQWAAALKQQMDQTKPVPHYMVSQENDHGYAQIIYEPAKEDNNYESNVHKSYTKDACGGIVVWQYAHRYAPGADTTEAGIKATLQHIAQDNQADLAKVKALSWVPACL